MKQRALYLAVGGLALCALAFWFTQNYAVVHERVEVGLQGEARANWLLAARMLLQRMGARVQETSELRGFEIIDPTATVFLSADRTELDPTQTRALLGWVKGGGQLVIAAGQQQHRDPVLQAIGVHVRAAEPPGPTTGADDVALPDGSHVRVMLRAAFAFTVESGQANWQHDSGGETRMLRVSVGDGLVTVMPTFAPFSNAEIGRFDHAELLWWLAERQGQQPVVWIVRHLRAQSLPQWLIDNALPAMIAFAVFLLLWLWRVIPRFGPVQPAPAADRRRLVEQLTAMGRFYAMQRRLPQLVQTLRQDGLELLESRAPETRGLEGEARLQAAARLARLRASDIAHAFSATVRTPHDFTLAVRALSLFRHRLSLPARNQSSRRRPGSAAGTPPSGERRRATRQWRLHREPILGARDHERQRT